MQSCNANTSSNLAPVSFTVAFTTFSAFASYQLTAFKIAVRSDGEYIQYATEGDLRDTENIPLKENIYWYFLREVVPHVPEAWINMDATKIGYEISFNKYFYQHKPLRDIEEVTAEILSLEEESEGLIREILNLS